MMQQYLRIKDEHSDCLLLFRLGDFYELFLEDAEIGAKVLDITLTSRARGKDGRIPMAGVPYHALDSYLSKLIKAGYKVAICEQVSDPSAGNLVDREVVRIVTPGTLLDSRALESNENNYIASVSRDGNTLGLAFSDISTGEFFASEFTDEDLGGILAQEFNRFTPIECILSNDDYNDPVFLKHFSAQDGLNIYPFHNWSLFASDAQTARGLLEEHFNVSSLHAYALEEDTEAVKAAAALLGYLKHTQKGEVEHIKSVSKYTSAGKVALDKATITNLELFSTLRDKNKVGSLIEVLDKTITAMGGRLLRSWLTHPLQDKGEIESRLEVVAHFVKDRFLRNDLREVFKRVQDIERLLSKVSVGLGNARDLVSLKVSLQNIMEIQRQVNLEEELGLLEDLREQMPDDLSAPINVIEKFVVDEPPTITKEGGMIKDGVSKQLDSLRQTVGGSKAWLGDFEKKEREKTGIGSLKVDYNKVFGFYIEVSKANADAVPDNYVRKQTLVNAERYITPELKEQEEIVLAASESINELEHKLFLEIVDEVLKSVEVIQTAAKAAAQLDCLLTFAHLAEKNNYSKPEIVENGELRIEDGRHPVVEHLVANSQFVPNDTYLNTTDEQLHIITGPNMAGKSVYIRQVALIVLMAHLGCFVPAKKAEVSLVDRIFVRSGASDVITEGLSTFMVEMIEAAYILNHATKNSLIVMDEIGRGTSTYDGISIASSIAEFLVTNFKDGGPKTLFSTHYHELQELENKFEGIKNYQVRVKHENEEPVFLHKVSSGGASHSFGVSVAKMAGIPKLVVSKAKDLLEGFEKNTVSPNGNSMTDQEMAAQVPPGVEEKEHAEFAKRIKELDIDKLSPIDALNTLNEIYQDLHKH